MLTGCIHIKEQWHKDKQDPDKEKYLNILKYVFRAKHIHNHFLEVYPKYKTNLLIFLELKLDNVVLVFLHVLLYQPHSSTQYKTPVKRERLYLICSFNPQKLPSPANSFCMHIYVQTHLLIYSLNVFALLPKLLQGMRRQHSQVAHHSTSPYQTECDIMKNCRVVSQSLSNALFSGKFPGRVGGNLRGS